MGKLVVRYIRDWKVIRSIPASGNVEVLLFFFLFLVEQTLPDSSRFVFVLYITRSLKVKSEFFFQIMRILADSQKSARLDGHVVRPVQHWQLFGIQ